MNKILGILLIFTRFSAFGQPDSCNIKLEGTIHSNIEEPTNALRVVLQNTQIGSAVKENGYFRIDNLCTNEYILQIRCYGETIQADTFQIVADTNLTLLLDYHVHNLSEYEVIIEETNKNTFTPQRLSIKEIDKNKGLSLGAMLEEVNGVRTLKTGNSIAKPIIHGLHSNRVLILNNGIRQEGQQWGAEHAPEIDPFISNNILVIKGANTIKYGFDAIGGAILIEPNIIDEEIGTTGEVNLIGFSNGRQGIVSGQLNSRLKKIPALSVSLQGSLKRGGNQHTPDYYLGNTGIKEYNFSTLLNWEKKNYGVQFYYSQFNTDLGIFTGAHIGNLTDLQNAFNLQKPQIEADFSYNIGRPMQHIEHELTKGAFYLKTGKIGKLNITYGRQYNLRYEYDKDISLNDSIASLNKPNLQLELTTHTSDINWKHYSFKGFSGEIGINSIAQSNTFTGRMFIPNYKNQGVGMYWIERKTLKKFILEAGARYDFRKLQSFFWEKEILKTPTNNYSDWAFNIGSKYKINKMSFLSLNVAKTWRPPSVNELYSDGLHHGAAAVEIGDEGLSQENAINTNLEYNIEKAWWRLNVQPYYNYFSNFIFLEPQLPPTLTIKGAFPTFIFKQTKAHIYGIDVFARADFTSFLNYELSFSAVRGYNITLNDHLIQIPADALKNSLEITLPENKYLKNNEISITHSFVAEQKRVPANSDFVAPPIAYNLLDLSISTILQTRYSKIGISVGVQNVFNTAYRDYLNRFRYYADELGRNYAVRIKIPINK